MPELQEFSQLQEDAKIYKQIGPVLVPQDKHEATTNVKKRLEFINSEIKRVEGQIANSQKTMETKRNELIELRTAIQAN